MSAAGILQQISERTPGDRSRRAAAGALVLRSVEHEMHAEMGCEFIRTRAAVEVASLPSSAEKSILQRVLLVLAEAPGNAASALVDPLVRYACEMESTRRLPEADAALALARVVAPTDAEIALHAGRVARQLGERGQALELYRTARELDGAGGAIARLAAIGEAVVSDEPEVALGRAVRRAIHVGDMEAAAVGLEERARIRRAAGRRRSAARDLCTAAARFADPVDRARVAHTLADLVLATGDPLAAREALLLALALGDAPQREHARVRLHTLSRDLGDQVGMRRWRSFERPSLVSLSAYAKRSATLSAAPALARWREALSETSAVGCPA